METKLAVVVDAYRQPTTFVTRISVGERDRASMFFTARGRKRVRRKSEYEVMLSCDFLVAIKVSMGE